ncbi:MAG: hypothetical protein SGCHY_002117 [Lobulomycetales sp.]
MPHILKSKWVPPSQSPAALYSIISNVALYPLFLPYCRAASVSPLSPSPLLSHSSSSQRNWQKPRDIQKFHATLEIGYAGIYQSYVSRVTLSPALHRVSIHTLSHNLFSHMSGEWSILPAESGAGSRLCFMLDFEFSNYLYASLASLVLEKVSAEIMHAFLERARLVSSSSSSSSSPSPSPSSPSTNDTPSSTLKNGNAILKDGAQAVNDETHSIQEDSIGRPCSNEEIVKISGKSFEKTRIGGVLLGYTFVTDTKLGRSKHESSDRHKGQLQRFINDQFTKTSSTASSKSDLQQLRNMKPNTGASLAGKKRANTSSFYDTPAASAQREKASKKKKQTQDQDETEARDITRPDAWTIDTTNSLAPSAPLAPLVDEDEEDEYQAKKAGEFVLEEKKMPSIQATNLAQNAGAADEEKPVSVGFKKRVRKGGNMRKKE